METVGSIQVVASINTKDYDAGKKHIENGNKDLEQDSERVSLRVSGKWGSALRGVGVTAAASFAAASAAVAAFGVSSIKSYAEYEQLVGGVDTLFKQSSGTVQQYAQTAYKTAGLSANQYMAQATSFSAKLLKETGGDHAKVAEMVNMAITDMADNANKMGTPLEMIQNAYEGLAKGNATMLDNLKIGYGGTQTELLKLAKDMGVVDQSVSSFNDISFQDAINAIHEVQNRLGITGTTAKEAAGTISGSWSSLTASWENVKIALASGNDDLLKGAIDGMIQSFANFSSNIIKVVPNVLNGLVMLIQTVIPQVAPILTQIISTLLPALVSGAVSLLNSLVAMIPTLISVLVAAIPQLVNGLILVVNGVVAAMPQIVQSLINALPVIVDAAVKLFSGLVTAIPLVIGALVPAIPSIIQSIVSALTAPSAIITLLQAAIQLFIAIVNAIPIIITSLQNALPTIIVNIVKVLTDPRFITMMLIAGFTLIVALFDGFLRIIANIPHYIGQIVSGIIDNFKTTDWGQVGKDIITGLANGIAKAKDKVIDKIKDIAKNSLDAIKKFFGIHSPSKVMAQMGTYMMQGWSIGMDKSSSMAISSAQKASSGILGTFDNITSPTLGINGKYESAGNVHRGEYVAPKQYVNQITGLPATGGSKEYNITNNYVVNNQADAEIISRKQAYAMGAV